jgi:choline-sulfatase
MVPQNSRLTNIIILFVFLLTFTELAALIICRPHMHGLSGVYYDNTEWEGKSCLKSVDTDISTKTLSERRTQLPQNIFSIQWTGYITIPKTGIYSFFTSSDDGSWLFIDDNLVVDNGGPHGLVEKGGKIHLIKGLHTIKIRYFQIGGFAVLEVFWAKDRSPKVPLPAEVLWPSQTGTPSLWIYQTGQASLPFLIAVWCVVMISLGISSSISLRKSEENPICRFSAMKTIISVTLRRLFVEPILFAGQQLKKPQVRSWLIVVVYTLMIYLTLSSIRTITNAMMKHFGEDILTRITAVTLACAGIGVLIYLIRSRSRVVWRLLYLTGIVVVYVYIFSATFREAFYAWTPFLGAAGKFLKSLEFYPIYPGEKVHLMEYGLLGMLLCKALSYHLKDKTTYLMATVLVSMIGMLDELIQWTLPNRVGDYRDAILNLVSGGLAILLVWLVIRPRVLQKPFQWASLRPFLYLLSIALIFTGVFLQLVQGFGSSIFMPDSGTQFVSAFPENQLVLLDKIQLQRLEGKLVEDLPKITRRIFAYEAQRHQYLRDWHREHERFFESYCEQEILKTYFRSYMRRFAVKPFEYITDRFAIAPDLNAHVFYFSPGQEKVITLFSQRFMWSFVAIGASLLCLLATFLPMKAREKPQQATPENLKQQKFERTVLRPLFGAILILSILITIYFATATEKPDHTNLLILTVDSCQPRYFGAYGYPKNTTPFFDKLASEGVLFSNAITSASWTIPSLVSLLTGVNPNVHGIDTRGKLMDKRVPTLFEVLEQHGYAIGDTSYTLTEPSINSVFKKTDISPEAALAEGRSEESYLLSWMEAHKKQPFFAWVHFHTVHLPYKATPPYNRLFTEDINPAVLNDKQIEFVRSQLVIRKGEVEFDKERHTGVIRALFTQALRQQDAKIGKVLMKLDELGLRDNTIIVITADHGEELLEHGFVGHASTSWDGTVYDDLIHVPLLIYYPKTLPKGKRIDTQVRTIDILPTVLDMLGISFSGHIQGKSLLPLMLGKADFQETAFSETTPCGYSCPKRLENNWRRAVRTNEWKLIAIYNDETKETRYELYHLKTDPGETTNVIDQYPDIAEQFKQEMQRWMEAPAQFPYQHKKSEEEHYLDVDVEVRPIVLFPKVGTVVTPETHNNRILVQWTGDKNTVYLIEYDIGTGRYHITGQLEVTGTEQWYGPFPEDIWQELPKYNPWKFRIIPKQYPQYASDWITFEMKYK